MPVATIPHTPPVAGRVRALREAMSFSLRDLAERYGQRGAKRVTMDSPLISTNVPQIDHFTVAGVHGRPWAAALERF
jgi:transcriptional regulator with XRE-family HTH domain